MLLLKASEQPQPPRWPGKDVDGILRSDLSRRNSPTIPTIPTSFGKLGFF
jgi:hypothetical protein